MRKGIIDVTRATGCLHTYVIPYTNAELWLTRTHTQMRASTTERYNQWIHIIIISHLGHDKIIDLFLPDNSMQWLLVFKLINIISLLQYFYNKMVTPTDVTTNFPHHPSVTKLPANPTHTDVQLLRQETCSNAMSVYTPNGGGQRWIKCVAYGIVLICLSHVRMAKQWRSNGEDSRIRSENRKIVFEDNYTDEA